MEIKVNPPQGARPAVVQVIGTMRLFEGRSDGLRTALLEALAHGPRVVVDLSAVSDIDSQGIGCVARCLATAISHKCDLEMVIPRGPVRSALDQVHLISVFPCHEEIPT